MAHEHSTAAPITRSGRDPVQIIWLENEDACDVRLCVLPEKHDDHFNDVDTDDQIVHGHVEQVVEIHASSQLLSKVPYFATSLSEAWLPRRFKRRHSQVQKMIERELILHCPAPASPRDFCACLKFLHSQEADQPADLDEDWTVDSLLKAFSVASYLGYEAYAEFCMKSLAASVWSLEEKAAVRKAFNAMQIEPSSDVRAKLQLAQNADSVLRKMIEDLAKNASCEVLLEFVKQGCSTSPKIKRMCKSALTELWESSMARAIKKWSSPEILLWSNYTRVILLHGDVDAILRTFLERSKVFCDAAMKGIAMLGALSSTESEVAFWLAECLERVVPNRMHNRAILLTNLERRRLLVATLPLVMKLSTRLKNNDSSSDKRIWAAVENVVLSLPMLVEEEISAENNIPYCSLDSKWLKLRPRWWPRFFSDLE